MREILFRGKRVKNGEWLLGSLYQSPSSDKYSISGWEVAPETVGQYTGLEDKNGNKVFEGDIVKEWSAWWRTPDAIEVNIYEVEYYHGNLQLIKRTKNGEHTTSLSLSSQVEVIGNIHDNPELLEADNE